MSSRCAARSMPIRRSGCTATRTTAKLQGGARRPAARNPRRRRRPSGFVAILRGGRDNGRTVLLRGDMDALPMQEETGLDFASTDRRARCTPAATTRTPRCWSAPRARCARRKRQPARHGRVHVPAGRGRASRRAPHDRGRAARRRRGPRRRSRSTSRPTRPPAPSSAAPGALLASTDTLHATITGRGGHAAMPHDTLDPIPVACEIVDALQTFSRATIAVHRPGGARRSRKINAGSAHNIVPDDGQDARHAAHAVRERRARRCATRSSASSRISPPRTA